MVGHQRGVRRRTRTAGINAGTLDHGLARGLAQTGQLDPGNTPPVRDRARRRPGARARGPSPCSPGWPTKVGLLSTELLPVVGEGVTGSPVIGPVDCPFGGQGPKVGVIPGAGPRLCLQRRRQSCYGRDAQGNQQDNALATDFAGSKGKYDTPALPAVGHPAFGNLGGAARAELPRADGRGDPRA